MITLTGKALALPLAHPVAPASLTCTTPPPLIRGDRTLICRGETVQLRAADCAGTVVWSTGDSGASIQVTPHQTTRYTAVCRLAEGCVSCFADAYTVAVVTPGAPEVVASAPVVCPGNAVTLTAACTAGVVAWTDASLTGSTPVVYPTQTTSYGATCVQSGCRSNPAPPITVQLALPTIPTVSIQNAPNTLCSGQSVTLLAEACAGQVYWSDGQVGASRRLTVGSVTRFRAVCRVGSCQSDSSAVLTLPLVSRPFSPSLAAVVRNTCPFQTADLARSLDGVFDPQLTYEFRMGSAPDAPLVPSPGSVLADTYYAFARTREGCVSQPVAISANVTPCANGIAPCLSNPPSALVWLDTLDQARGLVCLQARLRGSATEPAWACTGTGLLTQQQSVRPRYVASEDDRQRGTVTFTLTTPDPDGSGPCVGALARLTVPLSASINVPDKKDSTLVLNPNTPESSVVFIPEGFSPNDDGVNDRFVIRGVPASATVSLEVFNRWGHRVYVNPDYQNDWDGTANQGIRPSNTETGLPDGTYFYVARISDGREYVRFLIISR
ncbi:conserved repeat domain protein [Fibrella aestuarina BUZ 2]|uniref:Conserved repeat domain protein n=1 Tax=Fibrella aestuarina BUZ 2 TaxID=1166018 RepID=I0K3E0_9BACT|nr:gliding motility-associated C-terminal domain-containing protein [Fibrella aestuarina]CCG98643.1 conserved repeat domain protein [Fibrella aestuarina BUZ 2]